MSTFKHLIIAGLLIFASGVGFAQAESPAVESFSQAELEQILAPIALYPDSVLSHILVAATYPLEVIQAERWIANNPDLKDSDAVEAVSDKDWDPSVKALLAFPQILKRLSDDLEWTRKLGDAFLQDEEKLLASIQSLRQRAYQAGSLDDMDKVSIAHEDDAIVIESIEREVVYVPYYDPRIVYGPWQWAYYPPVYWEYPYQNHYAGRHDSPFFWGPRIHLSFGFFFSSLHWRNHNVVRIHNDHYSPRRYYNHQQILRHEYAERWSHNPAHRRGVAYRDDRVSDRYRGRNYSVRPSQQEVRAHRNTRQSATIGYPATRDTEKTNNNQNYTRGRDASSNANENRNARIANPNRFKQELSDQRIRLKQQNDRPHDNNLNRADNSSRNKPDSQSVSNNNRTNPVRSNQNSARPPAVVSTSARPAAPVNNQRQVSPPVQNSAPQQTYTKPPEPGHQNKQSDARPNAKSHHSAQKESRRQPR